MDWTNGDMEQGALSVAPENDTLSVTTEHDQEFYTISANIIPDLMLMGPPLHPPPHWDDCHASHPSPHPSSPMEHSWDSTHVSPQDKMKRYPWSALHDPPSGTGYCVSVGSYSASSTQITSSYAESSSATSGLASWMTSVSNDDHGDPLTVPVPLLLPMRSPAPIRRRRSLQGYRTDTGFRMVSRTTTPREAVPKVDHLVEMETPSIVPDVLLCEFAGCPKTFTGKYRRGTLQRHMRLKHMSAAKEAEDREYPCTACGRLFKRQDARLKHLRNKHPELCVPAAVPRK
jgi:hypothetical protein